MLKLDKHKDEVKFDKYKDKIRFDKYNTKQERIYLMRWIKSPVRSDIRS